MLGRETEITMIWQALLSGNANEGYESWCKGRGEGLQGART